MYTCHDFLYFYDCFQSEHIDINQGNINGDSPLIISCSGNHEKISTLLMSYGANVNQRNNTGRTPLFYACLNENLKIVQDLVNRKADVNTVTNDDKSALCMVLAKMNKELCQILIRNGLYLEDLSLALHLAQNSADLSKMISGKNRTIVLSKKEKQLLLEMDRNSDCLHTRYWKYLMKWEISALRVMRAAVDYERNKRDRMAFLNFLYHCKFWSVDDSKIKDVNINNSSENVDGFPVENDDNNNNNNDDTLKRANNIERYKNWLRFGLFGNRDLCRIVLKYLG